MQKRLSLLVSACLLSSLAPSYAAIPVPLEQQPVASIQSLLQSSRSAEASLTLLRQTSDFRGTTHTRLVQTFQGHPIWGAEVIVHTPKGEKTALASLAEAKHASMNGLIYRELNADLLDTPANVFSTTQQKKVLRMLQQKLEHGAHVYEEKASLMVFVDDQNKAHWAFLAEFVVKPQKGMLTKPTYIIDAVSMKIYQEWDDVQTLENVMAGGFGGNDKTGKWAYDGLTKNKSAFLITRDALSQKCYLQNQDVTVVDVRRHDAVSTFPCAVKDQKHNNIYWDAELNAINGAFSPDNDALYIGKIIKDMYQGWYGIPVLSKDDGTPMMLKMRVHEDLENAYWDGEQMTFGDGGSMFYPLVSLGVGAHEVSHGFTQQNAGLKYFGQSGGLNESFSDMAAQAAEYYSTGENTWQIGREITKEDGLALRYMDDPTRDCKNRREPGRRCSIDNAKDYHFGLNVHFSSGVYNKFFYLLSTTPGWNPQKAFDVMVQANRHYWTSLSTFYSAACGVVKAAQDFGYPVLDVDNALAEVGIGTTRC